MILEICASDLGLRSRPGLLAGRHATGAYLSFTHTKTPQTAMFRTCGSEMSPKRSFGATRRMKMPSKRCFGGAWRSKTPRRCFGPTWRSKMRVLLRSRLPLETLLKRFYHEVDCKIFAHKPCLMGFLNCACENE